MGAPPRWIVFERLRPNSREGRGNMSPNLTSSRMREPWPAAAVALITLTLQACGGGKSAPPPPPPTPSVTLSVSPTSITAGQSATLTWSSTQAVSCAASAGWTGSEALSGTQVVTPTASGSVTYTLTCTGAASGGGGYGGGGSPGLTAAQTATLTVNPATAFVVKALVADGAGVAVTQDTHLVNAWGLVFAPNDPVWISNNGTNTSSLYDGNGTNEQLLVALPADTTTSATLFQPTGIVAFDPTNFPNDFVVTAAGKSGPSSFIFS